MSSVSFHEKSNGPNAENTHHHSKRCFQNIILTLSSLGEANLFDLKKPCVECLLGNYLQNLQPTPWDGPNARLKF